jgi:hypothetical protein
MSEAMHMEAVRRARKMAQKTMQASPEATQTVRHSPRLPHNIQKLL